MKLPSLEPVLREAVSAAAVVLPARRRVALERWMRGRAEAARLARADLVVVSFGNSGRTWLRVLLSRVYQTRHGLPRFGILDFDNLHRRDPAIPRLLFTHDNYLRDYAGLDDRAALYRGRRLVLLARDPADVAVSQFYQWRHRMRRAKKRINAYPLDEDLALPEFVADPRCGVPKVVRFLNAWAAALPALPDALLLRYEGTCGPTRGAASAACSTSSARRRRRASWRRRSRSPRSTPCAGSRTAASG
jgi:hypothetical protein